MDSIFDLIFGPWLNAWWIPLFVVIAFPIGYPIYLLIEKHDKKVKQASLKHTNVWVARVGTEERWLKWEGTSTNIINQRRLFNDTDKPDFDLPADCWWEDVDAYLHRQRAGTSYKGEVVTRYTPEGVDPNAPRCLICGRTRGESCGATSGVHTFLKEGSL